MEPTLIPETLPFVPDEIPEELLRAANRDHPIRGRVKRDRQKVAIRDDAGAVVGFLCPHTGSMGWRLGPIYVAPEHRGHGYARRAVLAFRHLGLTHFVPDCSPASDAMHRAIGFEVLRRARTGTWYRLPR